LHDKSGDTLLGRETHRDRSMDCQCLATQPEPENTLNEHVDNVCVS